MTIDNSLFIIHWIHSFPFNASTIGCLVVRHAGIPALNIFSKNVKIRAEINKPGLTSIGAVRLTFSLNMKGFPTTNKTIERPMPITPPIKVSTKFSDKICIKRFCPVAPKALRKPISSFRFCTDDWITPVKFSAGTKSKKNRKAPDPAKKVGQSTF